MPQERIEVIFVAKGIRTVQRQLDSVGDKAQKAGARSQKMGDSIDRGASRGSRALRRTQNDMRRVGNEATRTGGRITSMMAAFTVPTAAAASLRNMQRGLRGLAGAISGFYAGRYLAQAFDDFTRIQNTLKGFGVSVRSVDRVTESITKLANEARTSSVETATLFGRLRLATRDLGLAESEVLELTGTLNKALRLSGSSGLEASQSVRQLSQAFNKGKLDGDEFRSVLENAPILTELLTKELNISKSELYDWAAAGKISTRVLTRAIQKGAKDIDLAFGKITPTIGDAFQQLFNNVRQFVGTTPEAGSAVGILTDAIRLLGENLNVVLGILEVYAAGFVIGKVIALFGRLTAGAKALSAAMKGVAAADALVAGSSALSGVAGAAPAGRAVGSIVSTSAQRAAAAGSTALPLTAVLADSKKVQSIWRRIAGFIVAPFRSVGSIIVRIVGSAGRLLRIFNPLYLILGAMVATIGSGFLSRLREITGETSSWKAVVSVVAVLWDKLKSAITSTAVSVSQSIRAVFQELMLWVNVAYSKLIYAASIVGRLLANPGAITTGKGMRELRQEAEKDAARSIKEGGIGKDLFDLGSGKLYKDSPGLDIFSGIEKAFAESKAKEEFSRTSQLVQDEINKLQDQLESLDMGGRLSKELGLPLEKIFEIQQAMRTLDEIVPPDLFAEDSKDRKPLTSDQARQRNEALAILALVDQTKKDMVRANDDLISGIRSQNAVLDSLREAYHTDADRYITETFEGKRKLSDFGKKAEDVPRLNKVAKDNAAVAEFISKSVSAIEEFNSEIRKIEGTEGLDGLKRAVGELQTTLKTEAEKVPSTVSDAAKQAAQEVVDKANSVLTSGAQTIAANVRAAFLGVLPGLQQIASIGGPETKLPGQIGEKVPAGAFPTLEQITKPVQDATSAVKDLGGEVKRVNDDTNKFAAQFPQAFKSFGGAAKKTANEFEQFFQSAFGTLEDALVEFVTTGEFDFKKFINAIIADLARLVIRMLIIRPLMNFFGGIFGFGFANGGLVGTDGTIKKYSTGGRVGGVGGTTSDNQLIMASRGEYVLNSATTRRIGAAYLDRLNSGGSPRSERRTVGSSTINFAPQITVVNDGGSDRDGQQQGEQIGTMVRQSFTELLMKETRPGGMLESVNRKGFA